MSVVSDIPAERQRDPNGPASPRALTRGLWQRWNAAAPMVVPPRDSWPVAVRRARTIGFILIGLQFLFLLWWSARLADRFALTRDYALFEQGAYLLSHGSINPWSTVAGYTFWQDHAMFLFLPISYLQAIWPHPAMLLWIQDAMQILAEVVALTWICEIVANRVDLHRSTRVAVGLIAAGVMLLVLNPWTAFSMSYDFHVEAIGALTALLVARDLYRQKRTVWLWVAVSLLAGDAAAAYTVAVGISAVLMGRRWMRPGLIMAVAALAWLMLMTKLGLDRGEEFSIQLAYGPLITGHARVPLRRAKGWDVLLSAVEYPGRALHMLSVNRLNLWANIASFGILGILFLPLLVPILLLLIEGGFASGGSNFALPGFQNVALYSWGPIGTIGAFCLLYNLWRKRSGKLTRWLVPALMAAIVLNAAVWAAVWIPRTPTQWLRVSPATASTLKAAEAKIPQRDQVIASQGVAGGFAYRRYVDILVKSEVLERVYTKYVWIVLAPTQGIESASVAGIYEDVSVLDKDPNARLEMARNGVWVYRVKMIPNAKYLLIDRTGFRYVPAWTLSGRAGKSVKKGAEKNWYTTSNSKPGYVVDESYWRFAPGSYTASVSLSVSRRANIELWNTTTGKLVKRVAVGATHGRTTVTTDFKLHANPFNIVYTGWGIWRVTPYRLIGNTMEARVWSPGGTNKVSVYSISLLPTHINPAKNPLGYDG
jgi:hypothetical protein